MNIHECLKIEYINGEKTASLKPALIMWQLNSDYKKQFGRNLTKRKLNKFYKDFVKSLEMECSLCGIKMIK